MGKWSNIRGKVSGEEFHRGGGILGKKSKIYKMGLQNKRIHKNFIQIEQWESGQICGENFLWGNFTGGEFWEKNENLQNEVAK